MLAAESPNLAKWRSIAVDGRVFPSYVFVGPRGGSVPTRLALLGRIDSQDLLSTDVIVKLLIELDLAPLLAQDFALFAYPALLFGDKSFKDSLFRFIYFLKHALMFSGGRARR
jgi:hypothetical protein